MGFSDLEHADHVGAHSLVKIRIWLVCENMFTAIFTVELATILHRHTYVSVPALLHRYAQTPLLPVQSFA